MSGAFSIRQFMHQQVSAIVAHSSVLRPLFTPSSRVGARVGAALLSPEEAAFLHKQHADADGDCTSQGRVVFAVRPPRHILRGIGGGAWNLTIGSLFAPIVGVCVLLSELRKRSFLTGACTGMALGSLWGVSFFGLAVYSAAAQVIRGGVNDVIGPVHYLFTAKQWDPLSCRFEHPHSSGTHPLLLSALPNEKLREIGMKRASKKSNATDRNKQKSGSAAESEEDYYSVLGVEKTATEKEIKSAYNRIVLKVHPDRNPSKEAASQFDRVTRAYRVLSNAEKRKKYDIGGKGGVDDLGAKKRDAVRAVFGGDKLNALTGDVQIGSFSYRVIDGLDFNADELALLVGRMRERCRDELLNEYLAGYSLSDAENGAWRLQLKNKLLRNHLTTTGLAKEVLFVVGNEYLRACMYCDGTPASRLVVFLSKTLPHRLTRKLTKWRFFFTVRKNTFSHPESLVNLAWHLSVEQLESTAWTVSCAVLLDDFTNPSSPFVNASAEEKAAERKRRLNALNELAESFVGNGKEYTGANKQSMDSLMDSLRSYQQEKSRQKD